MEFHVDPSAQAALVAVVPIALVAAALKTVTWDGAFAGIFVAGAISLAYGTGGLLVLAAFFVGGSVATRIGWKTKTERGTAEAKGGARDAQRIFGKGVVATLCAVAAVFGYGPVHAYAGAVAASLADTLGTEIGTLARGTPRSLPLFRAVPTGTPGAVSIQGTAAGVVGGLVIGGVAITTGLLSVPEGLLIGCAGAIGSLVESLAVGLSAGVRGCPGWIRNLISTGGGAVAGVLSLWVLP